MAHIIVVGAGIAGLPLAYELRGALGREHRVTLVNASDQFQFVPSNPWVAVGWRDRGQTTFPVARSLARKGIDFLAHPVVRIDAPGNTLHLDGGNALAYDFLVIATGPRLAFEEVPGSGPAAHTQSICTVEHAEQAWSRYREFLEDPGPMVIGAMPGASCFGPAYEFAFIVSADLKRRRLRRKVPITFVTSEPYIGHLGLGGVGDSKGMLESEFRNHDVRWVTNAKTTRVEAGKLYATELDSAGAIVKEH